MARYQTDSFTSASVGASATLNVERTGLPNYFNIVKVKVTPNTAGGSFDFKIHKATARLSTDLLAFWDNVTNLYDPMDNSGGSPAEALEGPAIPYEDNGAGGILHLQILNNDSGSHTYTVTIEYEEVPLMSSAGNATLRGSTLTLTDTNLQRAAANTLAQVNSTTAQEFRVYGTTTGPKYVALGHNGSDAYIQSNASAGNLYLGANNTGFWSVSTAGVFSPAVDNTYDLGVSAAANRVRNGFFGTRIHIGTSADPRTDNLYVASDAGTAPIAFLSNATSDTNSASLYMRKSRGSHASRTNVNNGDVSFLLATQVYSNSFFSTAFIQSVVDGSYTAGQRPPSRWEFYTNLANGSQTLQWLMTSQGHWYPGTDGSVNIGAGDTNRVAGVFISTGLRISKSANATGHIYIGDDAQALLFFDTAVASTVGTQLTFRKSRGSQASRADVVNGDVIGAISFQPYSGATTYWATAAIQATVDGTFTSNQRPPSRLEFYTNAANGAQTLALHMDHAQNIVQATAGLATNATDGFLYIESCAGAATGTVTAYSNRCALVYDRTNNQIYVNNAGTWKKTAALT